MFIGFLLCAFCQNCAVAVRDIKELEGVVSALGKFTRESWKEKSDFTLHNLKTIHAIIHT